MNNLRKSTCYEIRVRGQLSQTLLGAFPSLRAEVQGAETLLIGTLPDKAALHGVLSQIEALDLELLELRPCGGERVSWRARDEGHAHDPESGPA